MNAEAAVVMTKIFFADICIQLTNIKYQKYKRVPWFSSEIVKSMMFNERI